MVDLKNQISDLEVKLNSVKNRKIVFKKSEQ